MFMITKLLLNMYTHGFHSGHRQLDRGSIHKLVFLEDWLITYNCCWVKQRPLTKDHTVYMKSNTNS